MTPLFPAQRAAEEFEQVLAGTADACCCRAIRRAPSTPSSSCARFPRSPLGPSSWATSAPADDGRRDRARRRTHGHAPGGPSLPEERTKRRNRRLGTIAASLVVVGGTAGMAAAASGALPGETLYPIKRGIEQVTTAAHFGDAAQGQALLGQAATRLDEVRALQAEGNADPDVISQTIDAFRTAADSGSEKLFSSYQSSGDQADITTVRDFTAAADGRRRRDVRRPPTRPPTTCCVDAADTLADIDAQARDLCGACEPDQAAGAARGVQRRRRRGDGGQPARPPGQPGRTEADHHRGRARGPHQGAPGQRREPGQQVPAAPGRHQPRRHPQLLLPRHPGQRREPVTNVITPDGKLLPTVTSGAAVKDLVSGVTGTAQHRPPAARPTRSPSRSTTPPRSSATPWATPSARRPTASCPDAA